MCNILSQKRTGNLSKFGQWQHSESIHQTSSNIQHRAKSNATTWRQAVHVLGVQYNLNNESNNDNKFYLLILGNVVSQNCFNSAWNGKIKVLNIVYRQIFLDLSDLQLQVISGDDAIYFLLQLSF